jgi:peptide/nickel transport system substrate-binding protein
MLKRAGYAGEKVLYIYGGNITEMRSTGEVMADLMHRVGLNVETLNVEGAVMLQKRTSKEPIERGGWSAFTTGLSGSAQLSPPAHLALRGNGNAPNAWPGWCVSPEIERLRDAWLDAPDLASQQDICRRMQLQAMEDVPYYPLGQFRQPTAYRTAIGGMPNGFAMFWGVRPS